MALDFGRDHEHRVNASRKARREQRANCRSNMNEQRVLDNIAAYGCHVIHVLEEGDLPPFAYSIGIQKTSGAPEVIVVGLQQPMAHSVVNTYNSRVQAGESFRPGALYSGFIEGFDVRFEPVDRFHYREYLGVARRFYGDDAFDVLQLIFPSTSGVWPWADEAPSSFQSRQPILSSGRRITACG
jgi:hypothetical protein